MSKKSLTLVEIIIMLAIIVLLVAIAFPHLKMPSKSGETAKAALRRLSIAAENYATAHKGFYPASVAELSEFIPSAGSYCANATGAITIVDEYSYACILTPGGYTFSAGTDTVEEEGEGAYTVTTGGVFTPL
jgi:Tfp pilus assembly protein PilE